MISTDSDGSARTRLPEEELLRAREEADARLLTTPEDLRDTVMAEQVTIALSLQRARNAASGRADDGYGLATWRVLHELARASEGDARAELFAAAVAAGGGEQNLDVACLTTLAPMLGEERSRALALTTLATRELCDRERGSLIGLLPEAERDAQLAPRLAVAVEIAEWDARWNARCALLSGLSEETEESWARWFREACLQRYGDEPQWLYRIADDELTAEQERARADREREHFGAPFTAWRLGGEARGLEGAEERAMLDRAIDAFDEIALTPTDPGNDEGPFWAIARMLDEPQVRRAIAIVHRMKTVRWCYDLAGTRSALATRLAWLGCWREAIAVIADIGDSEGFGAHWRATAWGGVLAARIALEPATAFADLLAVAAGEPEFHDTEWRFRLMETILYELHDRASPGLDRVEACMAFAEALGDPKLRRFSAEHLIGTWTAELPTERWLAFARGVTRGEDTVETLLVLAEATRDARRDPRDVLRPLLALLGTGVAHDAVSVWKELTRYRDFLEPPELLRAWSAWLRWPVDHAARHFYAVRDFVEELPHVISWLGGSAAMISFGRALLAQALMERAAEHEPPNGRQGSSS